MTTAGFVACGVFQEVSASACRHLFVCSCIPACARMSALLQLSHTEHASAWPPARICPHSCSWHTPTMPAHVRLRAPVRIPAATMPAPVCLCASVRMPAAVAHPPAAQLYRSGLRAKQGLNVRRTAVPTDIHNTIPSTPDCSRRRHLDRFMHVCSTCGLTKTWVDVHDSPFSNVSSDAQLQLAARFNVQAASSRACTAPPTSKPGHPATRRRGA